MAKIIPSPELEAVVRRYLRAYGTGDKETVVNLLAADASLGYIGSSHDEIWRGDQLRQGLAGYMDEIPLFDWDEEEFRGFECGDLGWVEWICEHVSLNSGKEVTFRSTFVLALEKGSWRVVHAHNSNPVANSEALGYEARGFEELLGAALAAPADLAQTGLATIMFTDIADSTTIAATVGDTRWTAAVNAHVRDVQTIIENHGGTLIKSLGDGTMSSFPSARAALSTATVLQRKMAENQGEPNLQIRIGLHTGDLVENDGDVFGNVVNKAARIAAMAAPGDIRLSDATRIMVGAGDFAFVDPATVPLKGLEGEHTLYRLAWQAEE